MADLPLRRRGSNALARLARVPLALCALATAASHASDFGLLSVGVRARVGEKRVLGEVQPESFRAYDLTTSVRTPWEMEFAPGWGVGVRLLASGGVLQGAGKTALVASLIPVLAIGTQDRPARRYHAMALPLRVGHAGQALGRRVAAQHRAAAVARRATRSRRSEPPASRSKTSSGGFTRRRC